MRASKYSAVSAVLLGLLMVPAHAQTRQQIEADAENFARAKSEDAKAIARDPNAASQVPNFGGTDLQESQYIHGEMFDDATAAAANSEPAQLLSNSFQRRPKVQLDRGDLNFDGEENPENYVNNLGGQYSDCVPAPATNIPPGDEDRNCDAWRERGDHICERRRVVEVDEDYVFECLDGPQTLPYSCHERRVVEVDEDYVFECKDGPRTIPYTCEQHRVVEVDEDYIFQCNVQTPTRLDSCSVGRAVEVEVDWRYSCRVERDYYDRTCDRYFVPSCSQQGFCTENGGTFVLQWRSNQAAWMSVCQGQTTYTVTGSGPVYVRNNAPFNVLIQYRAPTWMFFEFIDQVIGPGQSYNISPHLQPGVTYTLNMTSEDWAIGQDACQSAQPGVIETQVPCCVQAGGSWVDECASL